MACARNLKALIIYVELIDGTFVGFLITVQNFRQHGSMIQHGVYHKNTRIFYRGKIVSSSYVQDCLNVGFLHAYQLFESYG